MYRLLFLLLSLFLSSTSMAATRFTYISPESEHDPRMTYDRELLRLALDKTRDTFGDYEMFPAPPMTKARVRLSLQLNSFTNLFAMDSYSSTRDGRGLAYARFPIHLGIVSYRICFVSPRQQAAMAKVHDLAGLRRFTFGQGKGWLDVEILRHAGLKVVEVDGYEMLFKMVARGRFDLLCRGASELHSELLTHKDIEGLQMDNYLLLYYPLPRVFYTNMANSEALKRVETGLAGWFAAGLVAPQLRSRHRLCRAQATAHAAAGESLPRGDQLRLPSLLLQSHDRSLRRALMRFSPARGRAPARPRRYGRGSARSARSPRAASSARAPAVAAPARPAPTAGRWARAKKRPPCRCAPWR